MPEPGAARTGYYPLRMVRAQDAGRWVVPLRSFTGTLGISRDAGSRADIIGNPRGA